MIYFVMKPGTKHYVYLFDNIGKRIGLLKYNYAIRLAGNGWIVTTFERLNVIRELNGLKELSQ